MSSAVATTGGGSAGKGKGVAASEANKKIDASGKTTMVARPKSATVVKKSEITFPLYIIDLFLLQFDASEPIDFGSEASPFLCIILCFFSIAFVKHLVRANVKVKTTIAASNASKTVTKTKIRAKTVKKVYSLPGQKHDPPEEREPLRIFYESLSKQIPSSEMAQFWMMEHGLLSPERARKTYDKKLKRLSQQRLGTPVKPKQDKAESSKKPPPQSKNGNAKAKKQADSDDDDDGDNDFIVKPKKARI
ncbi:hypothetical protein ZIOFF_021078 [Zingiber officinale]|uniref:Uncharacterized protein n=1 Tax=Zingiber officinale TaxID=94328 RepID=A0A8J5L898_ZINOF|nr:hypothetical protein ZIOFF_021078 [Zingiber officinale]